MALQNSTNQNTINKSITTLSATPFTTSIGSGTPQGTVAASFLTAVGFRTLAAATTGSSCTAVGYNALAANTTGARNTAIGSLALAAATTPSSNTAIGDGSGSSLTTGASNTLIGANAGSSYTGAEGNNIILGSSISGTTGESNVIRIGNSSSTNTTMFGTFQAKGTALSAAGVACSSGGIDQQMALSVTGFGSGIGWGIVVQQAVNVNGQVLIDFRDSGGVERGTISYNTAGPGVNYNTSSDYRLKEHVRGAADVLADVEQIKVRRFNFIESEGKRDMIGLIAHEMQETPFDYIVTGTKDELNKDGSPKYQQIDFSKLVPALVGAIQELSAKVRALEGK